jgi:thioredoxin-like negative regulator of GroEL
LISILAVPLIEWAQGNDDPNTLRARNNLAMCYLAAGQTTEAIPLLKRTLADSKRLLGANHPDTKAVRANLASLTGSLAAAGSH